MYRFFTRAIRDLTVNEEIGPSVEEMFGMPCDYRYLFVARNYVFYRAEDDCIRIINIYHEREDFMEKSMANCTYRGDGEH